MTNTWKLSAMFQEMHQPEALKRIPSITVWNRVPFYDYHIRCELMKWGAVYFICL